uniref:Penicillinase repressor n=1 Tax=Myoviridae sp. ctJfU3 TaxID=2826638 RepID=A0A8S5MN66_9CAUD|nr:MAG TPA: Penicillinase repressor [Myoviridae sp. ctJfU3]
MGEIQRLPECEELVMSIIWGSETPQSLKRILVDVNARYGKEWKPQTVSTFLCRLVKKGFLSTYQKGRYCYYVPQIRKEEYCESQLLRIVDLFLGGKAKELGNFINSLG